MLGFNALGRLALGQAVSNDWVVAAAGSYTFTGQAAAFKATLTSAVGAFTLNGQAVVFKVNWPISAGSYSFSGQAVTLGVGLTSAAGAYTLAGQAASFAITWTMGAGSYALTGQAAAFDTRMPFDQGAFAVTFNDAGLIRTGDDTDQVYGGVGHYLEALREARKREAITRKPPQPFVTRPPALRPYTPQQPVQIPDWSVLANPDAIMAQQQQAAIAQQQAAQLEQRKRREAQDLELLLLAA